MDQPERLSDGTSCNLITQIAGTGGNGYFLGGELMPGLEDRVMAYTKLEKSVTRHGVGRHGQHPLLGYDTYIYLDRKNETKHKVRLPILVVPRLRCHTVCVIESTLRGASVAMSPKGIRLQRGGIVLSPQKLSHDIEVYT